MSYGVSARATKASGLVDRINAATNAGETSELALKRIEREARELMIADPEAAHTALGGIAVLRGRVDDVRRHHRIALEQSGHSAQASRNYSVSLMRLGEVTDAFNAARDALRHAPDDADALRQAILAAIDFAHFIEAHEYCDRWNTLFPRNPSPHGTAAKALASAVEREVFREESVREVIGIAHEIRCAENVVLVDSNVEVSPIESDSFLYRLCVPLLPAGAVALNERFANRITNRPDLMPDPATKFLPMFIGTRIDVGNAERTA